MTTRSPSRTRRRGAHALLPLALLLLVPAVTAAIRATGAEPLSMSSSVGSPDPERSRPSDQRVAVAEVAATRVPGGHGAAPEAAGESRTAGDPEREAAERAADPAGLTKAERAAFDAYQEATAGRSELPPRGEAPAVAAPSNLLAGTLQALVPEGFVLVHQDADPTGAFTEAAFDRERLRIAATWYQAHIIDADHTLKVAVRQPGADDHPTVLDGGGRLVVSEQRNGFHAQVALVDGSLLVLTMDGPWRQGAPAAIERAGFEALLEQSARALLAG